MLRFGEKTVNASGGLVMPVTDHNGTIGYLVQKSSRIWGFVMEQNPWLLLSPESLETISKKMKELSKDEK